MQDEELKLRQIKSRVEQSSITLERLIDNIVSKYDRELDEEIEKVKLALEEKEKLSDEEVENLVMKVPVFMYFSSNGVETLGVEADMAKQVKLEVYNQKYLEAEGTINDKKAEAESMVINEQLVEIAFSRAYKKLKTKLEMAEHVFSGAKKVLSKRMQDIDLSKMDK